ncbi:hypothetical protein D3C87_1399960 [compost metagenome]
MIEFSKLVLDPRDGGRELRCLGVQRVNNVSQLALLTLDFARFGCRGRMRHRKLFGGMLVPLRVGRGAANRAVTAGHGSQQAAALLDGMQPVQIGAVDRL